MKTRIFVGLILGSLVIAIYAAIEAGLLPFDEYLLKRPVLTFLFGLVNLPVIIAVPILGITSNFFSNILFFLWWFIIGVFGTWIVQLIVRRITKSRASQA